MFRRKSGVWWTCIRHNGRKIQKSLETSDRKLAQAIEAKIRADIVEGKFFDKPKGSSLTVKDLINRYLSDHSKPNKAIESYKSDTYRSKVILKHFGKMLISEVAPRHISKFIKARRKDGVSETTIRHELHIMRHSYSLAMKEWELINESPFAKIKLPRGDNKRVRYLSDDEEKMLMQALPEWLKPIVIVAKETGMRLSNVLSLRWKQVNLFQKVVILETTKNKEPLGIPMTDKVFNILKSLSKIRRIDSDYIFGYGKDGKPFGRFWVSESFRNARKKAGIEDLRFHDLRHDFCSKLVQRGVDLYSVAGLAGHKDIKTTQRYAHLSPEKLKSAISVLNSDYNLTTLGSSNQGCQNVEHGSH